MLIGSSNCNCAGERREALALAPRPPSRRHVVEADHAGVSSVADRDDERSAGSRAARRSPGDAAASSGASSRSIAKIVAGLEPRRGDQRDAADLVQRVFELGQHGRRG